MGLSVVRADQPARIVPEIVRVSLWAVLGLWLARRLGRLLLLIVRSPTAMITITVAVLATLGWRLVHPALPLGVAGGLVAGLVVWRVRWPDSFDPPRPVPGPRLVRGALDLPDPVDGGDGHRRADWWPGTAPTTCRRCWRCAPPGRWIGSR